MKDDISSYFYTSKLHSFIFNRYAPMNRYFTFPVLTLIGACAFFYACSSTKNIQLVDDENIVITAATPTNDVITEMVEPYKLDLDLQMSEVLNIAEVDLVKGRPESALGNLLADLSLNVANQLYEPSDNKGIDFCLLNEGSIRNSIAKGPITLGNAFELMPFENELVVITLSYEKTMEIFDYLVWSGGEPISNAKMIIKDDAVLSALINGEKPDSNRTYKILTSDYLSKGGDKMYFFLEPLAYEKVGIKLRDAIISYFEEQALLGNAIYSQIDGRIIYE